MTRLRGPSGEDLNSTECPGEIVVRDDRGREIGREPCGAIISFGSTVCRRCKTHFAPGSLTAFRVPAHARNNGTPPGWVKRFLGSRRS
jgi:hypothetical protein